MVGSSRVRARMAQSGGLLRAAGAGVTVALLLGGGFVLYEGLLGSFGTPDCSNLSPTECSFAHEAAQSIGRLQLIFGGAMVALAIAVFVVWRTSASKPEESA